MPLIDVGRERTRHYGLFFAERKKERSLAELRSNPWFPIGGFTGGLVFCHKSTFQQLGGFDTIYRLHIDDFDLSARAHLHGWGIYTVTTTYAVHLGVDRKDDVNAWIESQRYHLCGFVRMILKNYRFSGVLLWTPLACLWILWKTIMKSVQTGTPRVLVAYITSVRYLFRDLGDTLEERRSIQSSRTVTQDVFRRVRSPRMKVGIALRP